jgi:Flp pilus assembly protein TadG
VSALYRFGRRIRALLGGLRADGRGVAVVEFAIITPFLILLYMGTIEISDLIAVDRRVTVVSGTTGDLVARSEDTISSSTLTDYFRAAEGIILPYSKTGLEQVVSLLSVNASGTTATVVWSQSYNGGTAHAPSSTYPLPAEMRTIAKASWVVVSEADYSYRPVLGMVVKTAISLHHESYYMPRYGAIICYNAVTC